MSTLKTNLIEPSTGTALTMGEAGGNVIVGADSVKVKILQDAGDGYKYAAFTSTGAQTWTCPTGVTLAEILVVAGGSGGGGRYYGGGGGAGGSAVSGQGGTGSANTGGGGGSAFVSPSGAGGSGIVIIRYAV